MRYILIIKKTKQVCHEFYADTDKQAIEQARQYLKGFSLNYRNYTLMNVGV